MRFYLNHSFLFVLLVVFGFAACTPDETNRETNSDSPLLVEDAVHGQLIELKRGDMLVRPNLNMLPGSAFIANGSGFGHAALVVKGYAHQHIDSLLAGIKIIESIAKDVPRGFQIREISGYSRHHLTILNNVNFGQKYAGNRYRLRLNLSETQIDSIIAFAQSQRNDLSSWNASKRFPDSSFVPDSLYANWADNNTWYCSLLVWQSIYYVTNIDLDHTGGYMVYPNDLIASRLFEQKVQGEPARLRF